MSDLEIQRYRRELERTGASPREVAAGLLEVPPERFLLLAPCLRQDTAPIHFRVGLDRGEEFVFFARPMTGVWGDGAGGECWHGLHAFPVLTVYEQVGLMRCLNTRGQACTLWDAVSNSRASTDGHPYLSVEDGWRAPRERQYTSWSVQADGSAFTRDHLQITVSSRCQAELDDKRCVREAGHVGYHDDGEALFRVPDDPPLAGPPPTASGRTPARTPPPTGR